MSIIKHENRGWLKKIHLRCRAAICHPDKDHFCNKCATWTTIAHKANEELPARECTRVKKRSREGSIRREGSLGSVRARLGSSLIAQATLLSARGGRVTRISRGSYPKSKLALMRAADEKRDHLCARGGSTFCRFVQDFSLGAETVQAEEELHESIWTEICRYFGEGGRRVFLR